NRRSASDCSCENGRRLSAPCFAGARSKKRPRPRGALPLPFSRWCHAARFARLSTVFIRQTKSATRMHVWNPTPALATSCSHSADELDRKRNEYGDERIIPGGQSYPGRNPSAPL